MVLSAIFSYVGRDEAAHARFYRALMELEMAEDRAGTIADLAFVFSHFKMPGDGLIPQYRKQLQISGAGISARILLGQMVMPLLTTLEIERNDFKAALRKCGRAKAPRRLDARARLS